MENVWSFLLLIAAIVLISIAKSREEKRNLEMQKKFLGVTFDSYSKAKETFDIPITASVVTFKGGSQSSLKMIKGKTLIWKTQSGLCFFPDAPVLNNYRNFSNDALKIAHLPFDKIEYFSTRGRVIGGKNIGDVVDQSCTEDESVSGKDYKREDKAIVGVVKKVEDVILGIFTKDTRETYINYFDAIHQRCSMFFAYVDYQTIKDFSPKKEYIKSIAPQS